LENDSTFDLPEADKCLLAYGELNVRRWKFIRDGAFFKRTTTPAPRHKDGGKKYGGQEVKKP
jgi:hypothetical protein